MLIDIPFEELETRINEFYSKHPDGTNLKMIDEGIQNWLKEEFQKARPHEEYTAQTKKEYIEVQKALMGRKDFPFKYLNIQLYDNLISGRTNYSEIPIRYTSRDELQKELIEIQEAKTECHCIRYYFQKWKAIKWLERVTSIEENKNIATVQFAKPYEFSPKPHTAETLYLLFWHLYDQKVILPNAQKQDIHTCFEALTGFSGSQFKKIFSKNDIESHLKNVDSIDNLILLLNKIIKTLQAQKEKSGR